MRKSVQGLIGLVAASVLALHFSLSKPHPPPARVRIPPATLRRSTEGTPQFAAVEPTPELKDQAVSSIFPTGSPESFRCSLYAGPMRWRRNPGGRSASTRELRGLPLAHGPTRLSPPQRTLVPFAISDIRTSGQGPFAQAERTNAVFLRSLRQDRVFFNFRACAGVPQPKDVRPYGGWERPNAGIRGHFVGHYLSALATGGAGGDASLVVLAQSALRTLVDVRAAHRLRFPSHVGYLASFPPTEFDKVEGLCHPGCDAWVPHYATQKLLSGLFSLHSELGSPEALPLALGMAEYVWIRGEAVRREKGEAHWTELLNYEVGALSEAFVSAASATGNASWLEAAALYDRRCFSGALALAGAMHPHPRADMSSMGSAAHAMGSPAHATKALKAWAQGESEAETAEAAIQGMHANAQLAYVIGLAARYDATGESNARLATEAYWRAMQNSHTYLSGGSSFMEEWKGAGALAESLTHRGAKNWAAHDHQESCVTHNHMHLSRRLLGWQVTKRSLPDGSTCPAPFLQVRKRPFHDGVTCFRSCVQVRKHTLLDDITLSRPLFAGRRKCLVDRGLACTRRLVGLCAVQWGARHAAGSAARRDGVHDAVGGRGVQSWRQPRILQLRKPLLVLHGLCN